MIFPFLRGWRSLRKAPITWLLFTLNAAVLLWGWSSSWTVSERLDDLMDETFFVETQGRVYENYLQIHDLSAPPIVRELASSGSTDSRHFMLMGHLAFRDENFMNEADSENLLSDDVAFQHWKNQFGEIKLMQSLHPSFLFGVSTDTANFSQWITYIFSHSSGWHFFGNMLFLVIFGAALEEIIGGLALLVVFLLTGVFAAGFFLWLSGPTTAPLIGASGAISGIMTMYCCLCWRQPTRFVYWLFVPTREAMGFVYLPAWTILVIWLLSDLAGYFGNLDVMGGIAHAAHLGGDLAGCICGLIVTFMWRSRNHVPEQSGNPTMWKLYPFFQWPMVRTALNRPKGLL